MSFANPLLFTQPGGPDERWWVRVRSVVVGGLAAVTAASSVLTPPVSAEEIRRISVTYRDLDLSSPDGLRTLKRRVISAAQTVCGYPLYGSESCVAQAVRSARSQMDRAVARGRTTASAR